MTNDGCIYSGVRGAHAAGSLAACVPYGVLRSTRFPAPRDRHKRSLPLRKRHLLQETRMSSLRSSRSKISGLVSSASDPHLHLVRPQTRIRFLPLRRPAQQHRTHSHHFQTPHHLHKSQTHSPQGQKNSPNPSPTKFACPLLLLNLLLPHHHNANQPAHQFPGPNNPPSRPPTHNTS